jgi:class 3 adenylate cyclase
MEPDQAVHYSFVAFDIEGFSTRADPVQSTLRKDLYLVVGAAVADAGLDWDALRHADSGDGMMLYVPASVSPIVLAGPMLRALQDRLAERERRSSAEYAMRLRVALHHGLAQRDAHGWAGDAINLTARLLDGQPVRDALAAAQRANMVVIVSEDLYQTVVRHRYRTIDSAAYRRVTFAVKRDSLTGWVSVPGYPAPPGIIESPVPAPAGNAPGGLPADAQAGPGTGGGIDARHSSIGVLGTGIGVVSIFNPGPGTERT